MPRDHGRLTWPVLPTPHPVSYPPSNEPIRGPLDACSLDCLLTPSPPSLAFCLLHRSIAPIRPRSDIFSLRSPSLSPSVTLPPFVVSRDFLLSFPASLSLSITTVSAQ